jgi:hypothetical protein
MVAWHGATAIDGQECHLPDTDDPFSFLLSPGSDVDTVQVNVSAELVGLYVIDFEYDYPVGGDSTIAVAQPAITIYRQE